MIPRAIRMADFCVRTYKTRDPFEIIERRRITLRTFKAEDLLGYFRVHNREQYIGLNENADERSFRTGAGHELGHSFLDLNSACKGNTFNDAMLYSLSTSRSERNANLFSAELLIDDEQILQRIYYKDYVALTCFIQDHINEYRTERSKFEFEQEQLTEFYEAHNNMGTREELAQEIGVDENLIDFKFQCLRIKGLDLPNVPETKSDFLKSWYRRTE